MKTVKLRPKEKIETGHYWIFSNQIQSSLKLFSPGEIVNVTDSDNHYLATGYINPNSLIAVRILSRSESATDYPFFEKKIIRALESRSSVAAETGCYRLVFGESDGLPGLVIDRYADFFVLQSFTAGMDRLTPVIQDVIVNRFQPKAIILRNDSLFRNHEKIEIYRNVIYGIYDKPVRVKMHGIDYELDLLDGQKTGFFLDQRENQLRVKSYVKGKRVLDCFSYVGGWSLNAAKYGASEVTGLDISEKAVEQCRRHAELNDFKNCVFHKRDVFDALKTMNENKTLFDVIILDPPAFVKSRAEIKDAVRGYREINRRAAKALSEGGILITCSCSHLVDRDAFRNTVLQGITAAGREAILLEQRTQAADHPILLSMRETEYLKCMIVQMK